MSVLEWLKTHGGEVWAALKRHPIVFIAVFLAGGGFSRLYYGERLNVAHERIEALKDQLRGSKPIRSGRIAIEPGKSQARVRFRDFGYPDMPSRDYTPVVTPYLREGAGLTTTGVSEITTEGFVVILGYTLDEADDPVTVYWQAVVHSALGTLFHRSVLPVGSGRQSPSEIHALAVR